MTKEEIIEMAKQAGFERLGVYAQFGDDWVGFTKDLETFAKLVAEKERELVADWLMRKGFATGHGDTIVDMLDELEWQVAEKEREACAKIADEYADGLERNYSEIIAEKIIARGKE
jgi:geranylgeranyl pyrophosphate synthase